MHCVGLELEERKCITVSVFGFSQEFLFGSAMKVTRFFFPDDISQENFSRACACARILISLILIHRFLDLTLGSLSLNSQPLYYSIGLILSFFLLSGSFVSLTLPSLLIINSHTAFNLQTQVTAVLFFILFFGKAGKYLSIDSLIFNRFISFPSHRSLPRLSVSHIRTLSIWMWGGICISAMSFHFNDPSWISGTAVATLLRTPYLNHAHHMFDLIDDNLLLLLSRISLYGMAIWELILWSLPGWPLLRNITFYWGLAFFISSILFINLSYLPFVEIVFWLLVYKPNFFSRLVLLNPSQASNLSSISEIKTNSKGLLVMYIVSLSIIIFNTANVINIYASPRYLPTKVLRYIGYRIKTFYPLQLVYLFTGQYNVNVFNQDDLTMNRYSILICDITDGENRIVPFQDINGARLSLLGNDNVYFSNSLKFQRDTRNKDDSYASQNFKKLAADVINLDFYSRSESRGKYRAHLLKHTPNYVNGILLGWNKDKAPLIVSTFEKDVNNSYPNIKKIILKPGFLFEERRIHLSKSICSSTKS